MNGEGGFAQSVPHPAFPVAPRVYAPNRAPEATTNDPDRTPVEGFIVHDWAPTMFEGAEENVQLVSPKAKPVPVSPTVVPGSAPNGGEP